eukprot:GHVS01022467.1.p1 GENE.GHVS01022467.1~~GHVS01022467.1.p1  ORF type:complete len:325 (-),score=88.53 GHVS01022467.1:257-1231(-)
MQLSRTSSQCSSPFPSKFVPFSVLVSSRSPRPSLDFSLDSPLDSSRVPPSLDSSSTSSSPCLLSTPPPRPSSSSSSSIPFVFSPLLSSADKVSLHPSSALAETPSSSTTISFVLELGRTQPQRDWVARLLADSDGFCRLPVRLEGPDGAPTPPSKEEEELEEEAVDEEEDVNEKLEEEGIFTVNDIIDYHINRDGRETFLTTWVGYPDVKEALWQSYELMAHMPNMLQQARRKKYTNVLGKHLKKKQLQKLQSTARRFGKAFFQIEAERNVTKEGKKWKRQTTQSRCPSSSSPSSTSPPTLSFRIIKIEELPLSPGFAHYVISA